MTAITYLPRIRKQKLLPILLIPLVLLVLNWGLYSQLAPTQVQVVSAEIPATVATLDQSTSLLPSSSNLGESGWLTLDGDWQLVDGKLQQRRPLGYDLALVYTKQQFADVRFDVTLQHLGKTGGGVMFGMNSAETIHNSHLVRFENDGKTLFWGFFDDAGNFNGQGFATLDIDPQVPQTLSIHSNTDRYAIVVNGSTIASDIPLQYASGYFALTTSQSSVNFEAVSVAPHDEVMTATVVELNTQNTLLAQVDTISGEWVYENGAIRQMNSKATDFVTSLNIFGGSYTLNAQLSFPDGADDAGGGFIFHMPERDAKNGAMMVRLLNGGQQIMWGRYDDDGVFAGEGDATLDVDLSQPIALKLAVEGERFSIVVNDAVVASDIGLNSAEGWISLIAYRGTVQFENVTLSLTTAQ